MDHYTHNYSSTRLFFKEENNIIWAMIRETIKENNLTVNFHKVKAHSGNYANDEADQLTNDAHNSSLPLTTINNFLTNIEITPLWKQLPIETHLRHFITKIS
jgi:ribonuclease HI